MRVAHQFGRHDVDEFLAELDADQYAEWCAYFAVEPQGWQAVQIAVQRLGFYVCQSHTKKKLDERQFRLAMRTPISAAVERMRWEAMAIRTQIEDDMRKGVGDGR